MQTTRKHIFLCAVIIWYTGGIILALKGAAMIRSAFDLAPDVSIAALTACTGIGVGLIKARYIFAHALRKNMVRITKLTEPLHVWQCYRPGFFVFLAIVITLSKFITDWAAGSVLYLSLVAILDLSISTALLASSVLFWKKSPPPGGSQPA